VDFDVATGEILNQKFKKFQSVPQEISKRKNFSRQSKRKKKLVRKGQATKKKGQS